MADFKLSICMEKNSCSDEYQLKFHSFHVLSFLCYPTHKQHETRVSEWERGLVEEGINKHVQGIQTRSIKMCMWQL